MPKARPSDLDLVHQCVMSCASRKRRRSYRIPALWNCWGYEDLISSKRGEIAVSPHAFIAECLDRVILPARGRRRLARRSLSKSLDVRRLGGGNVRDDGARRRGGDWIRAATMYGTLIRTSTAWDHNGDDRLDRGSATETGTFLKSILLLPLLAKMGADAIYMLPLSKVSRAFRKGQIGCPYSAKNFFQIEPDLHDRLLDDHGRGTPDIDVETQFAAFVEAAHAMGIRVLIDLLPRSASRDSDLILDHPDWFYWIDARQARHYGPPHVAGHPGGIPAASQLGGILRQDAIRTHLSTFRHAPNIARPQEWRRFAARCKADPPSDLLREIVREFGVITPPGFSDCMNDPQPPWSDVTFLRLYLDHPIASRRFLDDPEAQPPYVFTDTIKSSRFPGRRPNLPLWRKLAGVIPFYQQFGIDGARVDMGHALPAGLQKMIVERPRRADADFCLIAEELAPENAAKSRRDGYNALIGPSWYMEPRHDEGELRRFVHEVLPRAPLPMYAAAETPDTPRAAMRSGGRAFVRLTAVLNGFLPSAIPFIHSGLEMYERQPLNFGLDALPGRPAPLPKTDPSHDKLGFFDRTVLHWRNAGARSMIDLLAGVAEIRRRFSKDLALASNCFMPNVTTGTRTTIAVGWRVNGGRSALIIVANTDFKKTRRRTLEGLPAKVRRREQSERLLSTHRASPPPRLTSGKLRLHLAPGEVQVLLL
jgi:starch synthase (maltosyl-transferring)